MKVIYVAKHDSGGNDDEGAIAYAMELLGHRVIRVQEGLSDKFFVNKSNLLGADLVLFHKWFSPETLASLKGVCPRAFWYFDLVTWPDSTLDRRNMQRVNWMRQILPNVEHAFCTDGDWSLRNRLFWLTQGADERIVGVGNETESNEILFTGITNGGQGREAFVEQIRNHYGNRFRQIRSGCHREELKNAITSSKIVVCPSAPVSDRYWSNRVYNTAGFGGFIIHPYARELVQHYHANKEVVYYHSHGDLYNSIDYFLDSPKKREEIAQAALDRTKKEHLYRHRLMVLLGQVQQGNTNATQ